MHFLVYHHHHHHHLILLFKIMIFTLLSNLKFQVEDSELADVAAVSAGNDYEIGNMIAEAMSKVGRKGVVTLEEGKSAENSLYVVEGMQFDRGYISPYFVTDSEKMAVEYENCKVCSYLALSILSYELFVDILFEFVLIVGFCTFVYAVASC